MWGAIFQSSEVGDFPQLDCDRQQIVCFQKQESQPPHAEMYILIYLLHTFSSVNANKTILKQTFVFSTNNLDYGVYIRGFWLNKLARAARDSDM